MAIVWRCTALAAALAATLLLQGCDQKVDQNHIKVGVINGAEQDVARGRQTGGQREIWPGRGADWL
ncbi:D-methionine-binding lipoprotein metQ precursor [Serratia fonticola]|uniref:D-methionine-binding lipoprotein metQ n=1 Tax=Serratia fonticola TaxID=47917 RepID=A0A4U9W209_SERFO|nr:D-methionine-binding lipoprotein metQ precursor [Serratia fonticola]